MKNGEETFRNQCTEKSADLVVYCEYIYWLNATYLNRESTFIISKMKFQVKRKTYVLHMSFSFLFHFQWCKESNIFG